MKRELLGQSTGWRNEAGQPQLLSQGLLCEQTRPDSGWCKMDRAP